MHSRIIQLSLPTKLIFHILAPLAPSPQDWGLSFSPETFSHKFFPKFFPPKGRLTFCCIFGAKNYVLLGELFSVFSVRKIMRVRGTCRSANRGGGGSFCLLSIYQAGFHSLLLPESSITPQGQKGIESGQKGAKVNIYLLDFVSPREFRRPKGAKSKHIFEIWCECVWSCAPLVVVSTGVGVPAF